MLVGGSPLGSGGNHTSGGAGNGLQRKQQVQEQLWGTRWEAWFTQRRGRLPRPSVPSSTLAGRGGRHPTEAAWASPADASQALSRLHLPSAGLRAWGLAPHTAPWAPCPPQVGLCWGPQPPTPRHFAKSHRCSPTPSTTILTGAAARVRLGQAHPHA